ncbi:MAG: carboxymuconolactone decarboxylase family protein [Myxococcales bacterium]
MSEDDRYERGAKMLEKVYAGDVQAPPKGTMAFSDLMVENLFAEVWTRDVLSIRDRRLILLGVIGALGEKDIFAIQAKATLKNEELTPEQLREVVIVLANYAGYPRAAGVLGVVEQKIAEFTREQRTETDSPS